MAKAKPRKGGSGKNKKSGKHRGAPPKKKSAPKTSAKARSVAPAGRPGHIDEVDPGYYILKQYFNSVEYEVGRLLVDGQMKEHWFLYTLTQPSGSYNGYTWPDSVQSSYHSPNVSTRFVYTTPALTIQQICAAVGSISTYKICTQTNGSCS
jgi:hypothetical protein